MKSPREAIQPEAVPPPPPQLRRRRRSLVSIISGALSFLMVAIVAAGLGWSFLARKTSAPGPLSAEKTVNIPRGDDVEQTLEEQGVIDSAQLMKATLLLERKKGSVKSGEYLFKEGASLQDVIDTLVSGKQVLHAITIPEGLTSLQVVDRLRDDDMLDGDIKPIPSEGSLMPNTYKFFRGARREDLIKNMQQELKKVVADVWSRREPDTPIRSPSEMITLASIVEKETGKPDERPHVAGVFINRLEKNIPLQSDPTIVYGLVGGKGTLGRGILKSELEQKTPYNTYSIVGLPPGPIANPGKAALEAVASPSKTKDLYFVADGTGGHAFAETLDQHRANVQHWRQIEKDAKDKLLPDADKTLGPSTPAKPNQRGDAEEPGNGFGVLGTFASAAPIVQTAPAQPAPAKFPLALPVGDNPADAMTTALKGGQWNDVNLPGIEDGDGADPAVSPDPPEGGEGTLATFPVAPARQAEMKARAQAFGLPTGSDKPISDLPAVASAAPPLPNGKVRIFDASEGTALDPLRDTTYDLNSAKSVPTMKQLPPLSAYASP